MIARARRLAGWVALAAYLWMGAVLYLRVLPVTGWHWPPDFHLTGYDAQSIAPFLAGLDQSAKDAYTRVLAVHDRVFIVALALWLALVGWRGSSLRFVVAGLALLYAGIDLAENAALLDVLQAGVPTSASVGAAHHLTMAKFAALYLCVLVLIVHLRRTARGVYDSD
ncbi:hypothetical protein [Thalassorhabdomicrobium marinisediminis]|uniref:DUF4149 domain-containing protein n=1 Tax=Thalassorhabdomicrobium marinisediminis TaxID=2170577 RepID=A0A2T7FT50_9RHOB|nr:hypothetical protein [Thalassorhabdomicrobium marinisediminis]PVA05344.1 hypothetical protein DC363_15955 [Thalassorhabdomicrobium marinisediminis]